MKGLSFFLATVTASSMMLAGCTSLFKRQPAAVQGKHYVMTLHGVRGNDVSFGDFHPLIKLHLQQIDPSYEVVPLNITYKTAQKDFSPHTAALEINQKLDAAIPVFRPEDKLSVVAYSMGGQVGMIWLYDTLRSEKHRKYAEQTAKFVSLGAPFWGSKEAALGTNAENLIGQLDPALVAKNILKKYELVGKAISVEKAQSIAVDLIKKSKEYLVGFGKTYDSKILPVAKISFAELKALALGSDITNKIRLAAVNNPNITTKFVSLTTLVSCMETDINSTQTGCQSFQNNLFKTLNFDIFGKYTFGYSRRETDNSVITPSANAQFIYAVETDPTYTDGQITPKTKFKYFLKESQHKFYLSEGLHATLVPSAWYIPIQTALGYAGEAWASLADDVVLVYEKNCRTPETCKHPAYKHIVRELADCDRENSTCDTGAGKKVLQSFFKNSSDFDAGDQNTLKSELHGFTIEFNLRVPKGYDLSKVNHATLFDFIRTNFADKTTHSLATRAEWPYNVFIARPSEMGSLTINRVTHYSDQDQLRVVMTGLITPKTGQTYNYVELEKGATISLDVQLPGLKSRKIETLVRPYHSTYVDLILTQKQTQ